MLAALLTSQSAECQKQTSVNQSSNVYFWVFMPVGHALNYVSVTPFAGLVLPRDHMLFVIIGEIVCVVNPVRIDHTCKL